MNCARCYKETRVSIMSMFNTQTICMECADKEKERPDYKRARDADDRAIRSGDYNYPGIGLKR